MVVNSVVFALPEAIVSKGESISINDVAIIKMIFVFFMAQPVFFINAKLSSFVIQPAIFPE